MKYILISALLALTACSFVQGVINPSPNVVSTLEASLAAADNAALAYVTLPSCKSASAPKICRDPGITVKIGQASHAAYIAVTTAQENENASTVQAAQNAVAAYQSIVSAVQ